MLRLLCLPLAMASLSPLSLAQEANIIIEDETGTAPTASSEGENSVFDTLFVEEEILLDLNLCEEITVDNPGFGFGAQDFNTGCPDQIILRNKGLSSDAYEVTDIVTDPPVPHNRAVLRALDKLTGRLTDIELAIGEFALFETLVIEASACYKNPETETPEDAAFLRVVDTISGQDQGVFSGWMYASSPSLNPMDHAIYDVWVIDCTN